MPQVDGDSLKAEMAAQLRADWERARERRSAEPEPPPPEEPVPSPEGTRHRRFTLRRPKR